MEKNKDLIYGPEDRPPFLESVFAALQHLFAIFVAIMTPPLIIASQLNLDIETTSFLVSMALIASGVSTFLQCRRFGPVGTGLLCIQGTSYSFIGPIITAGAGGLGVVFGSCMAASLVEIFVGRILKYARRIITPVVSGIVVTLIGLCLIKVGISACGGGNQAMEDGTFGSLRNLGLASLGLLIIIFFNNSKNRYLRMSSIVIGLAAIIIGEVLCDAIFKKGCNFAVRLAFVVLGGVIYYAVMVIILWLRLDPNDLKLFTAIIVAIFLAVPHLQAQAKSSFSHAKKMSQQGRSKRSC